MAKNKNTGEGNAPDAAGGDIEGQLTIDQAGDTQQAQPADKAPAALKAPEPEPPRALRAGDKCAVFLMMGGSALKRVEGTIRKLHDGGRADINVRMPNGSVQALTMGRAEDHVLGVGYTSA